MAGGGARARWLYPPILVAELCLPRSSDLYYIFNQRAFPFCHCHSQSQNATFSNRLTEYIDNGAIPLHVHRPSWEIVKFEEVFVLIGMVGPCIAVYRCVSAFSILHNTQYTSITPNGTLKAIRVHELERWARWRERLHTNNFHLESNKNC